MRKATNQTRTLVDLLRAMDHGHPVTVTALKEEKDENGRKTGELVKTVRTLEIFDAYVSEAGDILIRAMDRETSERRDFRIERILFYTIHRTAFTVAREVEEVVHTELADEFAELGPVEVTEILVDRLTNRADRADAHGLSNLADLLWEAAANLEWTSVELAA